MINTEKVHKLYGLDYPELENRTYGFKKKVLQVVQDLSVRMVFSIQSRSTVKAIDELLENTELDQISFDNSIDYIQIFKEAYTNTEYFLYLTSQLYKAAYQRNSYRLLSVETKETLNKLLTTFHRFNLNYDFNIDECSFLRKLDPANEGIINSNLESIEDTEGQKNLESYKKCIDDFLRISGGKTSTEYYEDLGRLKKVLERSIGGTFKKGGKSTWLNDVKSILDSVFKDNNKEIETQKMALAFIMKKIHHDPEDDLGVPTPYQFNKQEYIYWWLQINSFIFLTKNSI